VSRPATPRPAPKNESTARYSGGEFQPLSEKEMRERAAKLTGWSNWDIERQGRIPPVDDPRTNLVDRSMVSLGVITPEELAELHEIGAQMDLVRPIAETIRAEGERAVRADREARAALKAQKKAESEERARIRTEAITKRRETDIIFLGRGVSGGLADRRVHVEKLSRLKLPVLATPGEVAAALGLTVRRLRWLAFHAETAVVEHYVRFDVPKKSGGVRQIAAPHVDMSNAQRWILVNVLEKLTPADAAHGFVPGRSTMSNAVPHVRQGVVLNADLKDFFPSLTFPRVKGIFQSLGYSPAVSTVFALLCTECPRRTVEYNGQRLHVATGPRALPQGACTSPALSNLCARRLDARLSGLAAKHGWTYTRYADDLTFSTSGAAADKTALIIGRLRHIVGAEHFTVNEDKTRVQRPNMAQSVTGIVVNQRPNAPRALRRKLRAILHQAKTTGIESQNRTKHAHFTGWVRGMIAYVKMTNPHQGQKLRDMLSQVDP
jgi:RNA-directed DNA polymerase